MQTKICKENRKSEIGKLYDAVHKEYDDTAWIRELVSNIKDDLYYSIKVEQAALPIRCTLQKSKVYDKTQEEIDKVIKQLVDNGIIAHYCHISENYGYFTIMELL